MRKTVDEMLAMGREGFVDAMAAEMEAKLRRPNLPAEERERLQHFLQRLRNEAAERRQAETAALRAA